MKLNCIIRVIVKINEIPKESRESVEDVRMYVLSEIKKLKEKGIYLDWVSPETGIIYN